MLDPSKREPVFLQIARALSADIRRGRLRPGERLPGTRTLAARLDVHRNTVVAAYEELAAQGWITSEETRGSFVASSLPIVEPARFSPRSGAAPAAKLGFALTPPRMRGPSLPEPARRGTLVLAGGVPDISMLPLAALARAQRRALVRHGAELLAYGDARGEHALRAAIAAMLAEQRGLRPDPDDVLVTRGAQQALDLVAEVLLAPGDRVAVEGYGYPPAWDALGARGTLVPIPVDGDGLDTAALRATLAKTKLRAVYVTPHHQYPTMVAMSPARRLELLAIAREHGLAIIEDDFDHEVHYRGRPLLPLASADDAGVVVYVGTLSKVLAPGLRLGYVVAPRVMIDALTDVRRVRDRQGDRVLEHAVAELFEDGELDRHVRRMRKVYAERRDALEAALVRELGDVVTVRPSSGGMALWVEVDRALDVERWAEASRDHGVSFATARPFRFDGRAAPFLRLGFAALDERQLGDAVKRMARARDAARAAPVATRRASARVR